MWSVDPRKPGITIHDETRNSFLIRIRLVLGKSEPMSFQIVTQPPKIPDKIQHPLRKDPLPWYRKLMQYLSEPVQTLLPTNRVLIP
jgi:hypothetical protein